MNFTMKWAVKLLPSALLLAPPSIGRAQGLGHIDCVRREDYIYLYSSMTTLEVRRQLKCGEQVQILARYDNFYYVRTENADTGYVPSESLLVLKTKRGAKLTPLPSKDKSANAVPMLTLFDGTPVRLKLDRTVSSAEAHVGDEVTFHVAEDVVVEGFTVIRKGTKAIGTVSEALSKGRFGKNGKLSLSLTSVLLTDNEKAALRAYQQSDSERHGVAKVLPLMRGKDVTLTEGSEIFGYVNGGMHLVASNFHSPKASTGSTRTSKTSHPND